MPQSLTSYIRKTGLTAAMANAVINPALAWLLNRQLAGMTPNHVLTDTAVTSVVLSLFVSVCVTWGAERDLKAGRIAPADPHLRPGLLLVRLPRRGWALGLIVGVGGAAVLAFLTFWLFRLFNVSELSFTAFALFKITYTPPLAYIVARWAILRRLLSVG